MQPKISFVLCSWKAPATLELSLESLDRQSNKPAFETILVNNGFSDERSDFLQRKFPEINLRIIRETQPGKAHALCAGLRQVQGEVIVTLDDDNSVEANFTDELLQLIEIYPNFGGICPTIIPKWEVVPPAWIQELGARCLSYNAKDKNDAPSETRYWPPEAVISAPAPPGGGMILHRDVINFYLTGTDAADRCLTDRVGDGLQGGQDYDIYYKIRYTNRGALVTPRLIVYHHIPPSRCKLTYLLRLNYYIPYYAIRWGMAYNDRKFRRVLRESLNFTKFVVGLPYEILVRRKPLPYCLCLFVRQSGYVTGAFSAFYHRS